VKYGLLLDGVDRDRTHQSVRERLELPAENTAGSADASRALSDEARVWTKPAPDPIAFGNAE
jgi:hypothetical protein